MVPVTREDEAIDRALCARIFGRAHVERYDERRAIVAAHHVVDVEHFSRHDSPAWIMRGLEDHFADCGDIQGMVFMTDATDRERTDDRYWTVSVDFAHATGREGQERSILEAPWMMEG